MNCSENNSFIFSLLIFILEFLSLKSVIDSNFLNLSFFDTRRLKFVENLPDATLFKLKIASFENFLIKAGFNYCVLLKMLPEIKKLLFSSLVISILFVPSINLFNSKVPFLIFNLFL